SKDMDKMKEEPMISEENKVNAVIEEDREMENNGVDMDGVEDVRNVSMNKKQVQDAEIANVVGIDEVSSKSESYVNKAGGNIDMINLESYANKLLNDIQLDDEIFFPSTFNDKGE
nr:hypothetical protein [Tanacetum cinerariifolium]